MGVLADVMAIKDREDSLNKALQDAPQTFIQGYMNGLQMQKARAEIDDLKAQAQSRQAAVNLDMLMKASTLKKNAKDLRDPQMFALGNAIEGTVTGSHTDYRTALDPSVASSTPPILAPVAVTPSSKLEERDIFGEFTQDAVTAQKERDLALQSKYREEKPPTAGQETTALYASRITQANKIFDQLENYTSRLGAKEFVEGKLPEFANFMKSGEMQSYQQAQKNFLNAVLRRESGAVISPSEFKEGRLQYFPQPGDKPDTLAQKKANRDLVMKNFVKSAGKAYVPYEGTDIQKDNIKSSNIPSVGGTFNGEKVISIKRIK